MAHASRAEDKRDRCRVNGEPAHSGAPEGSLKTGDVVEVEIRAGGVPRNPVAAASRGETARR